MSLPILSSPCAIHIIEKNNETIKLYIENLMGYKGFMLDIPLEVWNKKEIFENQNEFLNRDKG